MPKLRAFSSRELILDQVDVRGIESSRQLLVNTRLSCVLRGMTYNGTSSPSAVCGLAILLLQSLAFTILGV